MDEQKDKTSQKAPSLVGPLDIDTAIRTANISRIYANGFSIGHSLLEATILAQQGRTPIAAIHVTFPVLKSLYSAIGESIKQIERGLGEEIPTLDELAVKWKKNAE